MGSEVFEEGFSASEDSEDVSASLDTEDAVDSGGLLSACVELVPPEETSGALLSAAGPPVHPERNSIPKRRKAKRALAARCADLLIRLPYPSFSSKLLFYVT